MKKGIKVVQTLKEYFLVREFLHFFKELFKFEAFVYAYNFDIIRQLHRRKSSEKNIFTTFVQLSLSKNDDKEQFLLGKSQFLGKKVPREKITQNQHFLTESNLFVNEYSIFRLKRLSLQD